MKHPFQLLSRSSFRWIFWPLFLLTLLLLIVLNLLNSPLNNTQAPQGIISLELAGSQVVAESIVKSWDAIQQKIAAFGLGLDFLFIPVYSTALSLACVWTAANLSARKVTFGVLGMLIAWLQWVAAILDGLENIALMNILIGNPNPSLAPLASWCAGLKFGIIVAGMVWSFFALIMILMIPVKENA